MNLAQRIEHTNLSPMLTLADVDRLVEEAVQHNFWNMCTSILGEARQARD